MTNGAITYAYTVWVESLIAQGLEPWFVTYMFRQIDASHEARTQRMLQAVERVYGLRITRVIRRPHAMCNHHRRPILIAALDLPIFKHLKQTLAMVVVNDGLHVHAILLEPTSRRCSASFAEFAWVEQRLVRQLCPDLERIDVRAITHDVPKITGYALKQIEKPTFADNILILPRTADELRRGGGWVGRNSSIFGPSSRPGQSKRACHLH